MSKEIISPARGTYISEISSPQHQIPILSILKESTQAELEYEILNRLTKDIDEAIESDEVTETINKIELYLQKRFKMLYLESDRSPITIFKKEVQAIYEELVIRNKISHLVSFLNMPIFSCYVYIRPGALIAIEKNYIEILESLIMYEMRHKFLEIREPILIDVELNGLTDVIERQNIQLNIVLPSRETSFTYAVKSGYYSSALTFLKYGADPEVKLKDNKTLLMSLSEQGLLDKIQFLVEECGVKVDTELLLEDTPIKFALQNNHTQVAKYLCSKHQRNEENKIINIQNIIGNCQNYTSVELIHYIISTENIIIDENIISKLFWKSINELNIEKAKYILDNITKNIQYHEDCIPVIKKLTSQENLSELDFLLSNKIFDNIETLNVLLMELGSPQIHPKLQEWHNDVLGEVFSIEPYKNSEPALKEEAIDITASIKELDNREFTRLERAYEDDDLIQTTRYKQQKRQLEAYGTYNRNQFDSVMEILSYEELDSVVSGKKPRTSSYVLYETEIFPPPLPPEYDDDHSILLVGAINTNGLV